MDLAGQFTGTLDIEHALFGGRYRAGDPSQFTEGIVTHVIYGEAVNLADTAAIDAEHDVFVAYHVEELLLD